MELIWLNFLRGRSSFYRFRCSTVFDSVLFGVFGGSNFFSWRKKNYNKFLVKYVGSHFFFFNQCLFLVSLRSILDLLFSTVLNFGKLLFISNLSFFRFCVLPLQLRLKEPFVFGPWIAGTLTNFSNFKKDLSFQTNYLRLFFNLNDYLILSGFRKFSYFSWFYCEGLRALNTVLPSVGVFFDINSHVVLQEFNSLNLISAGCVTEDFFPFIYNLFGNFNSRFVSLCFFSFLFSQVVFAKHFRRIHSVKPFYNKGFHIFDFCIRFLRFFYCICRFSMFFNIIFKFYFSFLSFFFFDIFRFFRFYVFLNNLYFFSLFFKRLFIFFDNFLLFFYNL